MEDSKDSRGINVVGEKRVNKAAKKKRLFSMRKAA